MVRASAGLRLLRHGGEFFPETDDQCWLYGALHGHFKPENDYALDKGSRLFLSYTNTAWDFPYSLEQGRHVALGEGIEAKPTFIHFDSAHPDVQQMRALQACLPGSKDRKCTGEGAGWWPAPTGAIQGGFLLVTACLLGIFLICGIGQCIRNTILPQKAKEPPTKEGMHEYMR
jgi:hypothetical protein